MTDAKWAELVVEALEAFVAEQHFNFCGGGGHDRLCEQGCAALRAAGRLASKASAAERPPGPAPAAASAGLREAVDAAIADQRYQTEARPETPEEAGCEAVDMCAACGNGWPCDDPECWVTRLRAVKAAPLPEKQSEARAASAGEGALREAHLTFVLDAMIDACELPTPDKDWLRIPRSVVLDLHSLRHPYEVAVPWHVCDGRPGQYSCRVRSGYCNASTCAALAPAQREGK